MQGNLTDASLVGPLMGKTISGGTDDDLTTLAAKQQLYVNVHNLENPEVSTSSR